MNALAERFVGSVRREASDYYLLISEKQIEDCRSSKPFGIFSLNIKRHFC